MQRPLVRAARLLAAATLVAAMGTWATPASADAPSGAIFTTLDDGTAVNFNIYDVKEDVYLDGGPGQGAPQGAAGLDDGTYYFQVTDPPGKELLSTDPIQCRSFTVSGGIITAVVPALDQGQPCQHATGLDADHGATTVQLIPYLDTPNPGGEYKVWVTRTTDWSPGNGSFGFVPDDSKTDNFKVGEQGPMEIDTRFWKAGVDHPVDGLGVTWTDTNGASNVKWSYFDPAHVVMHEAHVEAAEVGRHRITIADQAGCTVGTVSVGGRKVGAGARTVAVDIKRTMKTDTVFVDVECR